MPVDVVVVEETPMMVDVFLANETPAEKRIRMLEEQLKSAMVKLDSMMVMKGHDSNISDRTLTIPVPEVGEIYIRFGTSEQRVKVDSSFVPKMVVDKANKVELGDATPAVVLRPDSTVALAGISPDMVQAIVQKVLAEQEAKNDGKAAPAGVTAQQLEKSLKEMENRLDKRISTEIGKVEDANKAQPIEIQVEGRPAPSATPVDTTAQKSRGLMAVFADKKLNSIIPVIGLRMKDGIDRVVFGARADYRFPDQKVRFIPEAAITIGEAVGITALANVAWYPYSISENAHFYAGTGAGLVSDKVLSGLELKLNLFAGIEYKAKTGASFFGEFSTLDFFDYNRIMFGYRILIDK